MKIIYIFAAGAVSLALGVSAVTADAQRGGDRERASFSELDANGDGEVTLAELQAHGAARFATNDTNGDGALSAEELVAARSVDNVERLERRINRFIERADENGDGLLQQSEIGPSQARMTARFERIDADGSGGLSEAEMEAAKEARAERGHRGPMRGGAETEEG
ncbi:MAG: calcium-binding protein [Pseudomonadota bacterium]